MKRTLPLVLLAALTGLSASACDDPNELIDGRTPGVDGEKPGSSSSALECAEGPIGRSYALFDGTKLEASRDNEGVGVNRARVKPFASMEKEYKRVLGLVPPSLKDAAGSFDAPAARWFGEADYSAVSLYALAEISFEACLAHAAANSAFATAPTEASAKTECAKLMRKAWSRSPSPEEIAGCVELATVTLKDEKDVGRRWAYTCASVLSSSQFLTF